MMPSHFIKYHHATKSFSVCEAGTGEIFSSRYSCEARLRMLLLMHIGDAYYGYTSICNSDYIYSRDNTNWVPAELMYCKKRCKVLAYKGTGRKQFCLMKPNGEIIIDVHEYKCSRVKYV